jgi:tetratricopeptide (TPR) repeat protein
MDWNGMNPREWRACENARAQYAKDPALYRLKLFLCMVLGYGILVLFGWLLILSLLFFIGLTIYEPLATKEHYALLIVPPVLALGLVAILRTIFLRRRPALNGMPLDPERYGRLYDEVGTICRELNIPPVRRICLDQSCTAAVVSPFLFMARLKRDTLVIGYPLICALDTESFRVCLSRALRHEKPSGDSLLEWIGRVCMEPTCGEDPYVVKSRIREIRINGISILEAGWFLRSIAPLLGDVERSCDAFCREEFGAEGFAAFVTRTQFLARHCDSRVFWLQSLAETDRPHPAAAIREKVRRAFSGANMKRILGCMLRVSDQLAETLPPFRERVRTDDPAALLPHLERTPDAAEHYLLSCPGFESEYDAWLENQVKIEKLEDVIRHLREAETLDESSSDPAVWSAAAEAAARLDHADRERDILEKAVERFPDCQSFRGRLLVRRMKDAVTDDEEAGFAAELERLTAEDTRLVLEFRGVLCDRAARRGDGKHLESLLAAVRDARKRIADGKLGKQNIFILFLEVAGYYAWFIVAFAVVRIMLDGRYGGWGYFIGTAVIVATLSMLAVAVRERDRKAKAEIAEKSASLLPDSSGNIVQGMIRRPELILLPNWENHSPVFPQREKDASDRSRKYCHYIPFSRKTGPLFLLASLFVFAGVCLIFRPCLILITEAGLEAFEAGDHKKAVRWFRVSAELGEPAAQCMLGMRFQKGEGVEKDMAEAVKWYRRAAEKSKLHAADPAAQNNLGECYRMGEGVGQDYAEAVKWYRLAAENGHARAQNNLGKCYENGTGVEQDYAEAARWYRRASAQSRSDEDAKRAAEALEKLEELEKLESGL